MNEDHARPVTMGFEQYVFVLKRQWRLVAALTVLGAVLAGIYLVVAPTRVTATTTLNLNVITTEPFSASRPASGLLDDATEADIASSHVVAARAADELGGSVTAAQIRESSTVSTTPGATVVKVAFEASTAEQAIAGADAVAAAYLGFRSEQADSRIEVMTTSLTERIDALNETLVDVNGTLVSAGETTAAYAQATTQREQILTELEDLLSQRNVLQSVDTTGGIVLTEAADSTLAVSPGRVLTLLTGLGAGLVLGVVVAFVRNPFDRRLRNATEIARELEAPVFATIDVRRERVPESGRAADGLRVARERMLVDVPTGSTVLVLDGTHAPTTSTTAVNLAVVTAQAGHAVQLIVPEITAQRRQELGQALDMQADGPGRSVSARIPELSWFIATDTGDENQGDPLLSRQVRSAVQTADAATLTFLVVSATAHPATILAALRLARAVVIVTRERSSTAGEIRWLRDEAAQIDAPILGTVVEKAASGRGTRTPGPRSRRATR